MACRALWNTTSDESLHSDVLSEIDFMYSIKESEKTLNVSSVMENSLKINEEKFGLSVSTLLCRRNYGR